MFTWDSIDYSMMFLSTFNSLSASLSVVLNHISHSSTFHTLKLLLCHKLHWCMFSLTQCIRLWCICSTENELVVKKKLWKSYTILTSWVRETLAEATDSSRRRSRMTEKSFIQTPKSSTRRNERFVQQKNLDSNKLLPKRMNNRLLKQTPRTL
jgi:hypothetical protein